MNKFSNRSVLATFVFASMALSAQNSMAQDNGKGLECITVTDNNPEVELKQDANRTKKAWEIGLGVSWLSLTRFHITDFVKPNTGYGISMSKRDAMFGGHLYVARELNKLLYIDMQGEFDYANDPVWRAKEKHFVAMAGLGLQLRFGELFRNKYIDPFVRVGANYMYKNFLVTYTGTEHIDDAEMSYIYKNHYNKSGDDKHHLFPISAGLGVNMWFNDRVGLGLQADYLAVPNRNVANCWHGIARIMWRIGGKSKKPEPVYINTVSYVNRPVAADDTNSSVKIVEKEKLVTQLLENIYFDFDKSLVTPESQEVLDRMATVIKDHQEYKYVILGQTDIRGNRSYNQKLSEQRAKRVREELIKRGVPAEILKCRGVGSKIAHAPYEASHAERRGDRKIFIEVVTDELYWKQIEE